MAEAQKQSEPAHKDFLISYAGLDRTWAEWIAATLEAEGYRTHLGACLFDMAQDSSLSFNRDGRKPTCLRSAGNRNGCWSSSQGELPHLPRSTARVATCACAQGTSWLTSRASCFMMSRMDSRPPSLRPKA